MARRLEYKTAIITGGSRGIGLATAQLFAAEGAAVVIVGREKDKLIQAQRSIRGDTVAIAADVSDARDIERAMQEAHSAVGEFDIVFANAGIARYMPIEQVTGEVFDEIIGTNVKGVFFTVQKALPFLKDGSAIILNASVAHRMGTPGGTVYAASKAAVRALARNLSSELVVRGVRVNVVSPGPISNAPRRRHARTARWQFGVPSIPMSRLGTVEEIARVVLFLASSDASFLLGAEIVVDGGRAELPDGAPVYRRSVASTGTVSERAEDERLRCDDE